MSGSEYVLRIAYALLPIAEQGPDLCLFHRLTGWLCPGCGMTHAFFDLGMGHVYTAIMHNPLSPVAFILGALWTISPTWVLPRIQPDGRRAWSRTGAWLVLILIATTLPIIINHDPLTIS